MPYIEIATGIEVYYERFGSGAPLLLIMGTGLDHSCWSPQVESYRDQFECIAFDNRGTGKTNAPEGPLSTKMLAEDAAALLDALEISRAHVSGLSLGSCIAQELVLLRPELVETLQLHGTWARAYGYAARKFKAQIQMLDTFDVREFYDINVLWFLTPEFMARDPERLTRQLDAIVESAPQRALLKAQYVADLEHDTLARLPTIEAPTLVTVGSFDLATPPLYAREVAAAIPNAELFVFEEGGHLHNVEAPDEFNRVTLEFLRKHVS